VEEIVELDLSDEELQQLRTAAEAVRQKVGELSDVEY
jgi:malate/lactate dehydrogenase